MKKILILSIFLIFFFSFATAESFFIEGPKDFSEDFGFPNGSFEGVGLEIDPVYSDDGPVIEISFKYWDSYLIVDKNYTYENIRPGIENLAYIVFNKNLTVILADFYTQNESGTYMLGNKTVEVPANSRVYYNGKTIEISVLDGTDMSEYGSLLNFIFGYPLTNIKGKNIQLPNEIYLKEGEIEITRNGFLLKNGSINYKKNLINIDSEWDTPVLIANKEEDLSSYEGTWIRQGEKELEVSAGDNTFTLEFEPEHEIVNNDRLDEFRAVIGEGNYLKIKNRNEEGLIPKMTYREGEEGSFSHISNDHFNLVLEKDEFSLTPLKDLPTDFSFSGKPYQSLAMEIEFDSEEIDKKININSYRQYTVLSKDNEELVTLNKYGLPVSTKIEDNQIQTLDQLREKYGEINFSIDFNDPNFNSYRDTYEFEFQVPPYLLYLMDNYFEESPDSLKGIHEVTFFNGDNAQGGHGTMSIGREFLDTISYSFELTPIREVNSPMQMIKHEHEHVKDFLIKDKELEYFEGNGSLELKEMQLTKEKIFGEIEIINSEIQEIYIYKRDSGAEEFSDEQKQILEQLAKERDESYMAINVQDSKISEYMRSQTPTLQQKYNEIAQEGLRAFFDEKNIGEIDQNIEKLEEEYIREEINRIIKKSFGEEIPDDEEISDYYQLIQKKLYSHVIEIPGEPIEVGLKSEVKEGGHEEETTYLFFLSKAIEDYKETKISELIDPEKRYISLRKIQNKLREKIEAQSYDNSFDQLLRTSTGLPYMYSLNNIPELSIGGDYFYGELSSTFREQPIEVRKQRINSGNPNIQKTYTSLTQLAFDSGKMSISDYKYLMPEGHCERPDCSDKICVDYKLLCCIENPGVPNC